MNKKLLLVIFIFSFLVPKVGAFEEIQCSTDTVFAENSCDQCFTGGNKSEGDLIGLLSDLWINKSENKRVFYKDLQTFPEMINLDTDNVIWEQTPSGEDFWEYSDEFNAGYDEENGEGYILEPGNEVIWIKSKLAYAYNLLKNTASQGSNIGLLVFSINDSYLSEDGSIEDPIEARECILFKSSIDEEKVVIEKKAEVVKPNKLPDTGPAEYMILAFLALILSFGFIHFRSRS